MKSIGKNLILLLIILLLTGCNVADVKPNRNDEKKIQSEKEYVKEKGQYIVECIINKDKEGMKTVFSKHTAEICDLDEEIEDFFTFFEGNITSYDEPNDYGGGYILKDGEYVEKEVGGRMKNIKTDTGAEYYLFFSSYQVCKKNKDYEGVEYILIVNETDKDNKKQLYIGDME